MPGAGCDRGYAGEAARHAALAGVELRHATAPGDHRAVTLHHEAVIGTGGDSGHTREAAGYAALSGLEAADAAPGHIVPSLFRARL